MSEDRIDQASGLSLRDGRPEDAEELFVLIRTAFSERLLQYSIYQASESVAYLRVQLGKEIFRVAEWRGVLVGYYHAVKNEGMLYVKYLAAIRVRECGLIAPTLVRDAIEIGRLMEMIGIECDVPAWNKTLIALYHRSGAKQISTLYAYKVDLSQVPKVHGLSISPIELMASLTEEKRQGLSKVTARWKSSEIVIGLLGGRICKILDSGGLSATETASLVSGYFPARTYLLGTSSELPDEQIPLASIDKLVRTGGKYTDQEAKTKTDHRE
jgi:hypothetical protein